MWGPGFEIGNFRSNIHPKLHPWESSSTNIPLRHQKVFSHINLHYIFTEPFFVRSFDSLAESIAFYRHFDIISEKSKRSSENMDECPMQKRRVSYINNEYNFREPYKKFKDDEFNIRRFLLKRWVLIIFCFNSDLYVCLVRLK